MRQNSVRAKCAVEDAARRTLVREAVQNAEADAAHEKMVHKSAWVACERLTCESEAGWCRAVVQESDAGRTVTVLVIAEIYLVSIKKMVLRYKPFKSRF